MKSIVVFHPNKSNKFSVIKTGELTLDGIPVTVGLMDSDPPEFDCTSIVYHESVLVEILAFSCNYRDRSIMLTHLRAKSTPGPIYIGSDFVGIIRGVGQNVKSVATGDRVIGNNSYPVAAMHEVLPGVPTNGASKRYLVLHECKVARIPLAMPLRVAAGFSVAAQTCSSMIRKLDISGGERCMVTGAASNTSLYALAILASRGVETYAVTTGLRDFKPLDVAGTIRIKAPVDQSIARNEIARRVVREHGGFDIVIDCFADIYASSVLSLLKPGGTYITCGVFAQSGIEPIVSLSSSIWRDLLAYIITNNITIYGNCLGNEIDLISAIDAYEEISARIPVDCVLGVEHSLEFVTRSFSGSRFGKVILRYDPDAPERVVINN
jgi:NADPH:quinone reductase-like Zn-dependent oxidoreductase